MRDERWVNRFLFAWNNTLFFDPLDVYYQPRPDNFLVSLDDEQRTRFVRSGIWWSHRHNPELPAQGWKIHVSADHRTAHDVAAKVVGYLTGHDVDFKIALDMNILEMLNSKGMARGSGGKFVTVYPRDEDEFRTCLADLAGLLDGIGGAYVLSDLRYRDSRALYFRYGQFLNTHTLDVMGRQIPHIIGPDGPTPDGRGPGEAHPWWVAWPFTDWKPEEEVDDGQLLGGRFRVTGALQFSNTGGVYTAEDTENDDRQVILKEARPHANFNPRQDYDAVDTLAREWTFLNRLGDLDSFPTPIATFSHWEHHFVAEEFIEGTDIRTVLLERNPLARPGFDIEKSKEFLRIFLAVFRGLAGAVRSAHERQVILGDLSAVNLLVDPETYAVTVIDLEACRLISSTTTEEARLESNVDLFTPGFSHTDRPFRASTPEDDFYGLATTMAYFVFPIAVMSYLREDVFDMYRVFTDALGWPSEIHQLLKDLFEAKITLTEAIDALEDEEALVARVHAEPQPPVVEEQLGLEEAEAGVAAFVRAVVDPDRSTLFPVDPFAHVTNPLSLGFGAAGVLWGLHASDAPIAPEWRDWLRDRLDTLDPADYADGLMNGLAGIAWAADAIGLPEQARHLLDLANRRAPEVGDHTFYYGLSGLGMTNLHFYLRGHDERDLAAALECARVLCETVEDDGRHAYWLNDFATKPLTGLGFGQAGVAMFLLRMSQVTGDDSYADLGRRALAWEMANVEEIDDGNVMFNHEGTLEPYTEVGSAGVVQVLLRYGDLDAARTLLGGLDQRFSVLPGYAFGLSGVAEALLDVADHTGDTSYRDIALRQLDVVRRVYLFEPAERFGVPQVDGVTPLALPGEGLLRCSCDYATGSIGVLRVLHRANHGGTANFLLDEVGR